jgi:hypothetical protein
MKLKTLVCFPVLVCLVVFLLYSSCKKDNLVELQDTDIDTTSVCDTAFTISYQNDIVPILQFSKHSNAESCYACHDEDSYFVRGLGNRLDGYSFLKTYVDDDRLLCAIKHEGCAGAQNMPEVGDKLEDCDILRIEAWVNQGAPNN